MPTFVYGQEVFAIRPQPDGSYLYYNRHGERIEAQAEHKYFGPIVTNFRAIKARMKELGID